MDIAIGINHAIVGEDRVIGGSRKRVYRDLGVGQHSVRHKVPDSWLAPESFQTVVSAMQHHMHPDAIAYWVECADTQLRTMLMRHYNVPEANTQAPPNWGLPKDAEDQPILDPEPPGDEATAETVEPEPEDEAAEEPSSESATEPEGD